jgi:integrase/recombinase XerC
MIPALPAVLPPDAGTPSPPLPGADALALLLADKRSPGTRRAYAADLGDFFRHAYTVAEPTPDVVAAFLGLPAPQIALHLAGYKAHLLGRRLSEATINRRLAAVRSLLAFCYRLGLAATDGRGLVRGEKHRAYRDTRGIDEPTLRRLVALPGTDTLRGLRDTALLRLLGENALRRAEVCSCTVSSFSAADCRLLILGKGRGTQREPVTLSPRCAAAIAAYLEAAGHGADPDGALFRNVDPRPDVRGRGLTVDGLYDIVRGYGRRLDLNLSCHKLRHTGITLALEATNGDLRACQQFSRHADPRILIRYDDIRNDDRRRDRAGEITRAISDRLEEKDPPPPHAPNTA